MALLENNSINSNLIKDNVYIDLKYIYQKNSRLFIEGIAFIENCNAKDYKDIDYKLILKNDNHNFIKQLAKDHKPKITAQFSKNKNISYDKCWVTTYAYEGVDLSDIPKGNYQLELQISCQGVTKTQKIRANPDVVVDKNQFNTSIKSQSIFSNVSILSIDEIIISNETTVRIPHVKERQKIIDSFQDTDDNILTAPTNLENCFITIKGKNNVVEIDNKANLRNVSIEFVGDNGYVKIGRNVRLYGTLRVGYNCSVVIGNDVTSTNPIYLTCAENTKVSIGDDCMFATNNQIRTDDAHAIYDVNTGKRVNKSKNITLGKHVWIGYGATLFGGAEVGDGSVIGAFSLVNKKFPNNCVVAGIPAKLVKKDVFWERPLLLHADSEVTFSQEEMDMKDYCIPTQSLEN